MPDYFVFGGCLRSELEFPELAEARTHMQASAPSWTFAVGELRENHGEEILAETQVGQKCRMRVTRRGDVYRYWHSCAGLFEIGADRRTIVFQPTPGADIDLARTDLLSRVLLLALDDRATLWLHGSAVATRGGAIGFLGASGVGKSTLALALTARGGASHICDDTLAIEMGGALLVRATDHTLRLCSDSRELLAPGASAVRREVDGKFIITRDALRTKEEAGTPAHADEAVALAALYLLKPRIDAERGRSTSPGVVRTRITPMNAVPALMPHAKLGPIVRDGAPARMLMHLASVARRVPTYELTVTRDLSQLNEIVDQMLAWHPPTRADELERSSQSA